MRHNDFFLQRKELKGREWITFNNRNCLLISYPNKENSEAHVTSKIGHAAVFKHNYKFLYFYFLQLAWMPVGFCLLDENAFRGDTSSVQEPS